ncbi:MAG: DUF58 domain-containing protein [Proteobacteria bacterium]|nr:DUF58 domain-containing protein [Pseudomonadota bacterium]
MRSRGLLLGHFLLLYRIQRWGRLRLTRAGLLFLAGLVLAGVFGMNTNRTLAYQTFAFLASLLVIALVSGLFFRTRFSIVRVLPRYGTAGHPLTYRLRITNHSDHFQQGLSAVEDLAPAPPTPSEFDATREPNEARRNRFDRIVGYHRWAWIMERRRLVRSGESPLPPLPPRVATEVELEVLPLKRGILELDRLVVSRPDPFGLFKSLAPVSRPQSLTILPKRYPLRPLDLPGLRRHQPGGVTLSSSVGESEEFVSVRDYRPGDPLRRIHWKSWAKAGRPIVKEYQDEFFVRQALVLDTFTQDPADEAFEEAVSVAASFASAVQSQDALLDLMFVGAEAFCFTCGRGLAHMDRMLEILAAVRPCRDKPFEALTPVIMERSDLLSACVLVLLAWDDPRRELVRGLRGLGLPLKVLRVARPDTEAETLGPMADRPSDFHRLETGRIEEGLSEL